MASIMPTDEQLKNIYTVSDHGELVMVTLLRFKSEGGEALYEKFSQMIYPIIKRIGARIIYYGSGVMAFIGDEHWDAVMIVEYPSRSAFAEMINDRQYMDAVTYWQEALVDARVYITRPQWMG
ncbi:MAG: DUF1330 domain-containing protein [Desulfobacterales bacterium]